MNHRGLRRLGGGVGVAVLVAAGCRDYDLLEVRPWVNDHQGGAGAESSHNNGAHGGEQGKPPEGGSPGAESGAAGADSAHVMGGEGGTPAPVGGAGAGGAGAGGAAADAGAAGNDGGGAPDEGPPSDFGTVIVRTAVQDCSGTLLSNAWVLSSTSCVGKKSKPAELVVQYGSELANPQQTSGVVEIVADSFDGETNSLTLLRLARPFVVDGSASGFARPYYPRAHEDLHWSSLLCYGVRADARGSASLRPTTMMVVSEETETLPQQGTTATLWLQRNKEDRSTPQPSQRGGPCFLVFSDGLYLVGTQLDSPELDSNGKLNVDGLVRLSALTNTTRRRWLFRSMLGQAELAIEAPQGISAFIQPDGSVGATWLDSSGDVLLAPVADLTRVQNLGHPTAITLAPQRPAAIAWGKDILAVAFDEGLLWWRRLGETTSEWAHIESAVSPTSGAALVQVDGIVHLFALSGAELHETTFNANGWQGWINRGGDCTGTPSTTSWGEGRYDVFIRTPSQIAWTFYVDHDFNKWVQLDPSYADPVVIATGGYNVMYFTQDDVGNLRQRWHNGNFLNEWLDTGVVGGKYLAGVSKAPGTFDLIIGNGGKPTHYWWPR